MKKILIVEDDANIREIVRKSMEYANYVCAEAEDGNAGVLTALKWKPDLILLDLMLPELSGLSVLKTLRAKGQQTPVVIITAKNDEADKVIGLELGADDYISKPFSVRELSARVGAVLRRFEEARRAAGETQDTAPLRFGDIEIDTTRYEVRLCGETVALTLKEFEFLRLLAENRGRVFTREQLLERVWGYEYSGGTRTVDVHVRYLRKKLGEDAIVTIRGVGYKLS